jgi:hypothetical protein
MAFFICVGVASSLGVFYPITAFTMPPGSTIKPPGFYFLDELKLIIRNF